MLCIHKSLDNAINLRQRKISVQPDEADYMRHQLEQLFVRWKLQVGPTTPSACACSCMCNKPEVSAWQFCCPSLQICHLYLACCPQLPSFSPPSGPFFTLPRCCTVLWWPPYLAIHPDPPLSAMPRDVFSSAVKWELTQRT